VTIIDAHHHLWDLSAHDQPFLEQPALAPLRRNFLLSELEPQAAAQGVTSTVLVQTITEPGETPEMLALAADGGLVTGVVGWADLEAPGVGDALAGLRELPGGEHLVGIRHPVLVEPDPAWLARPAVLRGLAAVAEAGLVYDVVAEGAQLRAVVTAATATPQLTFVLDHLGNPEMRAEPDGSWLSALRAFAALPNTAAKLSGILSEPPAGQRQAPAAGPVDPTAHLRPYYEIALSSFGPQRLMFGSDWPVSTLTMRYADVVAVACTLTASLSGDEQAAVFHGTARRIYGLRPAGELPGLPAVARRLARPAGLRLACRRRLPRRRLSRLAGHRQRALDGVDPLRQPGECPLELGHHALTGHGAAPHDLLRGLARGDRARRLGDPHPALCLALQQEDLLPDPVQVAAEPDQHLGRHAIALAEQAEQEVLGADVVIAEQQRLAQRQFQHLLGPWRERDVPGWGPGADADGLLHLVAHGVQADIQRRQRPGGEAPFFIQQPEQNVLGAHVVVVQRPGLRLGQDERLPRPVGEPLEHLDRLRISVCACRAVHDTCPPNFVWRLIGDRDRLDRTEGAADEHHLADGDRHAGRHQGAHQR
jgi:L-fuconolactonase